MTYWKVEDNSDRWDGGCIKASEFGKNFDGLISGEKFTVEDTCKKLTLTMQRTDGWVKSEEPTPSSVWGRAFTVSGHPSDDYNGDWV